jgi:hypothetical protein
MNNTPLTKLIFSLQKLHHGWRQAVLSDSIHEVTLRASSVPSEPFLPLLWAVRLLLLGANESKCIWWEETGQYRWLFSRRDEQIHIHIIWFDDTRDWSDDRGKIILRMECSLLAFAKRFSHQLGQLEYQEKTPVVAPQEHQILKEAITVLEYVKPKKRIQRHRKRKTHRDDFSIWTLRRIHTYNNLQYEMKCQVHLSSETRWLDSL